MTTSDSPIRVDAAQLRDYVAVCLERLGLRAEDARTCAEVMVEADLRGVESHGVAAMMSQVGYVAALRQSFFTSQPEVRLVSDRPGISVWDGGGGLGMIVGVRAMRHATERAAASGVHIAAVRNSRHFGMAGYYAMLALERGQIGMASTNAGPSVLPTFGRQAMYGTNPIAFAAPAGEEDPFVLDMATSAVAYGKVGVAARHASSIPLGWAADATGHPTADPRAALAARAMLPLGSTPELSNYKGYGLAIMMEILCGGLAGGPLLPPGKDRSSPISHWFMAVDVGQALDPKEFRAQQDEMLRKLRATPPAEGYERVMVAGEREFARRREALANGVPLHPNIVADLNGLGAELGLGELPLKSQA